MRQIGTIQDESSAKKLIAFLLTEEIKSLADKGDSQWEIWIKEEDDVDRSKQILDEFIQSPDDPKYAAALEKANQLAREELERQEKSRQNVIVMRSKWSRNRTQKKPMVVTLIIISAAVFMMTAGWQYSGALFGGSGVRPETTSALKALLFVNPDEALARVNKYIRDNTGDLEESVRNEKDPLKRAQIVESHVRRLQAVAEDDTDIKLLSIKQGQFWRLFTPMFIHFGILHILFNMMWLNSLGGQFEDTYGTLRFGVFVLTAAVVAQVIQQLMPTNMQGTGALTYAGGMSGVNFALGGFIWVKSIYEPRSGLMLSPVAMFTLILILFIGIVDGGQSLSMANWAHGGGFVFGLLCGYLPILRTPAGK